MSDVTNRYDLELEPQRIPVPVALVQKADGEWHPAMTNGQPEVVWLVLHEDGSVTWEYGDE